MDVQRPNLGYGITCVSSISLAKKLSTKESTKSHSDIEIMMFYTYIWYLNAK